MASLWKKTILVVDDEQDRRVRASDRWRNQYMMSAWWFDASFIRGLNLLPYGLECVRIVQARSCGLRFQRFDGEGL